LRCAGTGSQRWLAPELATLSIPILTMAGLLDLKFSLEAQLIADTVADGKVEFVADAHHAAHLEQPELAAALVQSFIRQS
jgi:pimeloyl-ACP methyl ester carboxylesterase